MSDWVAIAIVAARIVVSTCAVAVLMSGCAYIFTRPPPGLCGANRSSPIRDFCVVVPRTLWEGKRPSSSDAGWLLTNGVQSIVSIQVDDRTTFRTAKVPPEMVLSVPYFRIGRFNAIRLLSRKDLDDRVALFVAIMREAPKPAYLHCHMGVDRALVLAAAYRILIQGLDSDQAIQDLQGLHSPWLPVEIKYLRGLTTDRKLGILRKVASWAPRVRPTGEVRCLHGRCGYLSTGEKM